MKGLTLKNIAKCAGGELYFACIASDGKFSQAEEGHLSELPEEVRKTCIQRADTEVSAIVTDSRKTGEGSLFGAIVGARVDGHDFISKVFGQGAACVLSEKDLDRAGVFGDEEAPGVRAWIRVEDTLAALGCIARAYLEILDIPVVGITGSVGKTSTKEMIASVLSVKFRTKKTEGNFNNDLGLPLTVFSFDEQAEMAVLEMGISHFGDMTRLAKIARPNVMVITNIGTCHLEFLGDRDGVFRAKTEVFDYLKPDGRVILNGNDDKLRNVSEVNGSKVHFFGVDSGEEGAADLSAGAKMEYPGGLPHDLCVSVSDVKLLGFEGAACTLHLPQEDLKIHVPTPGLHSCSNAAAAAAVGLMFGMTGDEIRRGIESAQTISGRLRVLKKGDVTVVDDCYNANPVSMKSSVAVLSGSAGRRVAILGDMKELGEQEAQLHESVGVYTAGRVDHLVAIGDLARHLYEAAKRENENLSAVWYAKVDDFLADISAQISAGDTVLVKASHSMQFDRIVEELTK